MVTAPWPTNLSPGYNRPGEGTRTRENERVPDPSHAMKEFGVDSTIILGDNSLTYPPFLWPLQYNCKGGKYSRGGMSLSILTLGRPQS